MSNVLVTVGVGWKSRHLVVAVRNAKRSNRSMEKRVKHGCKLLISNSRRFKVVGQLHVVPIFILQAKHSERGQPSAQGVASYIYASFRMSRTADVCQSRQDIACQRCPNPPC